ncbi:MAG: hypothetical protein DYG92_07245 [Leptolyngbya sp. PLA1]|nr:hypothetical protein [Leptolyngbya sp. PLA1]
MDAIGRWTTLWVLCVAAGTAVAQQQEPPQTQPPASTPPPTTPAQDPGLSSPSVGDRLLEQQRRGKDDTPIEPVRPARPQTPFPAQPAPEGATWAGRRLLPEGAFVTGRRGEIVISPGGDVILTPSSQDEPPMILMPCGTLGQIRTAWTGSGEVTVSGQAFSYRGRQYLLPSYFSFDPMTRRAPDVGRPEGTAPAADGVAPAADPSVTDLINDLERDVEAPRALSRLPVAPAVTEAQAASLRGPDGTVLLSKRARLVRSAEEEGRLAVVFDNDPDSVGGIPLVVLPCRAAESLEAIAASRGESTAYRVSGRVFVHEGKGYILPTLVQAVRRSDVRPLQ